MNDQQLEHKVLKDTDQTKKDISILAGDGAARLSRGFEKLTGDAKETVVDAAETVKKGVGQGLSQYNAKAQEFADQVPGDFSQKAARYPWVAISIALAAGFLLGGLLKPARRPLG
jgi:ElaB/YqjD/DUF883 family membrane-anchored ribosome-binding protein